MTITLPNNTTSEEGYAILLLGYETRRMELTNEIAALRRHLAGDEGYSHLPSTKHQDPAQRRTMSPAARKRISLAQKKRWAQYHKKHK